ncbi:MAG: hypothetical protein J5I93_12815, partial [Pirellulaceae bacterium]|nr:hypothetical protein [Pirellulaceae bacterium]
AEGPQPAAGASPGTPAAGSATRRSGEPGTSKPEAGDILAGTATRPGPMPPADNSRAVAGGGAASGETPPATSPGVGDTGAPGSEPMAADVPQPTEAAADPARVTRIVVAPDGLPVGPETRRAESLKLALALATEMPLVTRIELHVPGTQTIKAPLDFPAELLVGRELTVAAGAGYQPRILFQPQPQDLGDTQRPRMLRVTQGSLRLIGLHLRFELPADDRQSWSLFYLDRVESLYLEQCTLTVHNPYGSLLDDRVAFFEVASPRENDPAANGSAADETRAVVTNLSLLRCSARGQATLVRAERSVPLRLTWQQGFFSTTQGLLDVGGLKTPPRFEQGIIGLELRHVTAVVGPGLCRLRTEANYPHQRDVNAQFENCVFVASESPSPLFEYRGTLSMEEVRARITVKGFGNYYDGTDVILRVRSPEAFDLPFDITFSPEDRLRAGDERWYREVEPQPAAMLNLQLRARPGQATEQHTPADFQVLRREESMEAQSAGFDLSQIPQFPSDKLPPPGEPASLPPAAEPASSQPVPPL